MTFRMNMV